MHSYEVSAEMLGTCLEIKEREFFKSPHSRQDHQIYFSPPLTKMSHWDQQKTCCRLSRLSGALKSHWNQHNWNVWFIRELDCMSVKRHKMNLWYLRDSFQSLSHSRSRVDCSGPQEIEKESVLNFAVLALPGLALDTFYKPVCCVIKLVVHFWWESTKCWWWCFGHCLTSNREGIPGCAREVRSLKFGLI